MFIRGKNNLLGLIKRNQKKRDDTENIGKRKKNTEENEHDENEETKEEDMKVALSDEIKKLSDLQIELEERIRFSVIKCESQDIEMQVAINSFSRE